MAICIIHPTDIRVFSKRMLTEDEYAIVCDKKDRSLLLLDNLYGEFMGSEEMGDDTALSLN
jgi:hypothetical protein